MRTIFTFRHYLVFKSSEEHVELSIYAVSSVATFKGCSRLGDHECLISGKG